MPLLKGKYLIESFPGDNAGNVTARLNVLGDQAQAIRFPRPQVPQHRVGRRSSGSTPVSGQGG